jgi:hypothetical protein
VTVEGGSMLNLRVLQPPVAVKQKGALYPKTSYKLKTVKNICIMRA